MKKRFPSRLVAIILSVIIAVSCITVAIIPASAATYRNGAQSGPSSSYKNGRYYSNYTKVPLTGDNRTDLLAIALSQLGYQEGNSNGAFSGEVAGSSNYVEFSYNMGDLGLGYGGSDYPWCACFVSWCLYQSHCTDQATYKALGRYHVGDYDYIWKEISCSQWVRQLKGAGYYKYSAYEGGSYTPKYGDLVFFQNSSGIGHIGICLYTSGGRIYTVEGNTSDSSGLETNGGGVYFKNYSLSSSYLNGYGVLPYKTNSSVAKIDYTGSNPTPGLYVSNAVKYIYSSETATTHSYTIPRFSMFEITKIGSGGSRLYGTFTTSSGATVTGWISNNSDRIIQLSSSGETTSPEELARENLQTTVNNAKKIRHYNYAETTINEIRTAYSTAVSTLANTSATEAQLKNANSALTTLLAKTGSNTIALNNEGVFVSGRNSRLSTGDCFIYSPSWNNGLITVSNANIAYTVNVVAQWDSTLNCNVVKSVTKGIGADTPSIQLQDGEFLIAAHDWESGLSASDNPVAYSSTNYRILSNLEVGSRVYLSGCTALNSATDVEPAAFIKFSPPDSTRMTGKDVKMENGDFVLYTPAFNNGLLTHSNSNVHRSLNVVAGWDEEKSAWIVLNKFQGNGNADESSNIEIEDGQVVISGIAWEAGVTDGTKVAGSTANWNRLNTAEIGQKVIFSGITPNYNSNNLSISANIDFVDYTGADDDDSEAEVVSTNLALGKSYETAFIPSNHNANLTDGKYITNIDYTGGWFGFHTSTTGEDGVGHVTIDLGALYNLDEFKAHIYPLEASAGIGPPSFVKVYTSYNGVDFIEAGELALDSTNTKAYWASLKSDVTGRYVRFSFGPNDIYSWVFLNELEVYGTSLTGSENIALGASQTVATADEAYFTSLVDGVADTTIGENKWLGFLSSEHKNSNTTDSVGTVTLDLGSRFRINEVKAHLFAGENSIGAEAPASATVYVSIDGDTYAKAGTMELEGDASAPFYATLTNSDAVGRYIRIDIGCTGKWTLINEVEAYGVSLNVESENNIALEKSYAAPSYSDSPFTANLTDGIASNIFQYGLNNSSWFAFNNTGDTSTGNVNGDKGIITVDLGGQAEITKTSIHLFAGANDANAKQPQYINVYISDDGETYDYLKNIDIDATKSAPYWATAALSTPVYARYVKFAVSVGAGEITLLNEIKVFGTMLTNNESNEPGSMSAITLAGSFNDWNATPNMQRVDSTTVSVSMELTAGKYEFKILEGSAWYGNAGVIENTTATTSDIGWEMTTDASNCTLTATGGMYTFLYNTETKMLKVLHTPDTYYIRGTFNDWGTWDILSENSDGTFSKTITLDAGTYEFKAANEDFSKAWPEFNQTLTLDRKADVTFTLDIFDNTLNATYVVKDFYVTFLTHDGKVIDTQLIREGGSAVAPAAPERNNYRFTGWSEDITNITKDTTVKAKYEKTIGNLKVDITGGTGFTISVNDSAPRAQGTTYQSSKTPVGAKITLVAKTTNSNAFLGWVTASDKRVVTTSTTLTFYASGNDYYQAMYRSDVEGCGMVAFCNDKTKQYIDIQYYSATDSIEFPEDPTAAAYDFVGWDHTEAEIQAQLMQGKNVTIMPIWEIARVYVSVDLTGGTVTAHSGTQNGKYLANVKITVTADAAQNGMKFAYWMDDAGKIRSFEEVYSFYPAQDTTLMAIFVTEDTVIDYEALASVNTFTATELYGQFSVSWFVPEEEMGVTYIAGGLIAVNKDFYSEETFYHGTTDTNVWDKVGNTGTSPNSTYIWTGPVYSGETWVAKAWVQFKDATGVVHTIYSDLYTAVKN